MRNVLSSIGCRFFLFLDWFAQFFDVFSALRFSVDSLFLDYPQIFQDTYVIFSFYN